jgi:hypothetical protein
MSRISFAVFCIDLIVGVAVVATKRCDRRNQYKQGLLAPQLHSRTKAEATHTKAFK